MLHDTRMSLASIGEHQSTCNYKPDDSVACTTHTHQYNGAGKWSDSFGPACSYEHVPGCSVAMTSMAVQDKGYGLDEPLRSTTMHKSAQKHPIKVSVRLLVPWFQSPEAPPPADVKGSTYSLYTPNSRQSSTMCRFPLAYSFPTDYLQGSEAGEDMPSWSRGLYDYMPTMSASSFV
ncbi:hypothetical protein M440DRAFT_1403973 [Trichoderma longibrachiatum ATCC 18648]|uniref:Uncharacterized protein n=1 Tax=Trichoderma longibrachiatum ATCC 18648 TaxID=983965 RepID=A0A2T4BWQ9_TRILO|nr:hypothetical protein M440DRAFT_1403973 [Trichoderma longibrachiatum ATCC 18648]